MLTRIAMVVTLINITITILMTRWTIAVLEIVYLVILGLILLAPYKKKELSNGHRNLGGH